MRLRDGTHSITVTFGGVTLQCEGTYYGGFRGNQIDPPEAEAFEFHCVKHRDEDVFGLLGEAEAQDLEELCISELRETA